MLCQEGRGFIGCWSRTSWGENKNVSHEDRLIDMRPNPPNSWIQFNDFSVRLSWINSHHITSSSPPYRVISYSCRSLSFAKLSTCSSAHRTGKLINLSECNSLGEMQLAAIVHKFVVAESRGFWRPTECNPFALDSGRWMEKNRFAARHQRGIR